MNSGSGQSYMDKLKAKNIPPTIQEELLEEQTEQKIPMVQISAEEWNRLCETIRQMQGLSRELMAQRVNLKASAESYTTAMKKAAEAQTEAAEKAMHKIAREAVEQVGKASERASEVINKRIWRDEAIWWIRLALTAIPTILVLLLWAHVGLGI